MKDIEKVLQTYFDACYEGSTEKVRDVFHPASHVYGVNPDGSLADMPLEAFVEMVASSPKLDAQVRETEIIAVDFTGDNTAVARVRLRLGEIVFTDALSLAKINSKWQIIAKLYSAEVK